MAEPPGEAGEAGEADRGRPAPRIEDFLAEPTRDLEAWRWLWTGDHRFPVRSHRGLMGRVLVLFKRALRPLVQVPQNDLWERQRVFNLILLERVVGLAATTRHLEDRVGHVERIVQQGLDEVIRHHDALYARLDAKVDAHRADARELLAWARSALLAADGAPGAPAGAERPVATAPVLARAFAERGYVEFERRYRGTEAEIAERVAAYLPHLRDRSPLLDLGCGRGEALALLSERGVGAIGVDESPEMVRRCRAAGHTAEIGDAVSFLEARAASSLDAVVSFHVVEHLPAAAIERLIRLAWRVLEPGGLLLMETPNALSIAMAASHFWRDPTHRRPLHPDALRLSCEQAGFESVEIRWLHPFPASERLPEIDLDGLDQALLALAHRVNELRDRLDAALYGYQDYAVIAIKGRA